ncbi:MAG: FadR family transcriptional regulator [Solobacterium sp.]|nr:FadR family transcriptional regulator [Solobacterium sp.]
MAKRRTLAETTAEEIKQMIQRNGYEPGQKLPTEKEMTDSLGVGRNTLREALRILQSHNIVTIRQGSGTYISDKYGVPDDPFGFELFPDHEKLTKDILEILVMLEPEVAAMAAEHRTEEDLVRMERLLRMMSQKIDQHIECLDEECKFYEMIAEASHNIVMVRMTPLMTRGIRYFAATLSPKDFMYGVRNYYNVLEGIRHKKASEARTAMSYHLLFLDHQYKLLVKQHTT